MKKTIITLLVALLAIVATEARPAMPNRHDIEKTAKEKVDVKSDDVKVSEQATEQVADENVVETAEEDAGTSKKMKFDTDGVFIKDKDGNPVKVKYGDLSRIVRDHLDDTLLSEEVLSADMNGEDLTYPEVDRGTYNLAQDGMDLARDISTAFFISIVWIVALSLLFYYLHRRRKYKTIDRAIQAGYPLPSEFFSKRSAQPLQQQQPTTVYVNQVAPPQQPVGNCQQPAASAHAPEIGYGNNSNPLNNITDWTPYKGGLITTAVGLGLLFFFWIAGAAPIAALMSIVIFIGLGKLFFTYQEQQNARNYWQQQKWNQAAQQWQQWQQPGSSDVPPMPADTPPEFDPTTNFQSNPQL